MNDKRCGRALHSPGELPLWVGECGGISLVVAGFVWTQLTDVEGELNGLLTTDRRPKVDPAVIRAALDAVRERHLTDRQSSIH